MLNARIGNNVYQCNWFARWVIAGDVRTMQARLRCQPIDERCVSQRLRSSAGKMMQVFKCNKTYTLRIAICVTNFAHRCANVWADRRLIMKHCYSVLFSYNAKIIVLFDAGIHVESTCLKFCSLSDVYIMSWNKHRTLRFGTIRFRTDFKDWNPVQH